MAVIDADTHVDESDFTWESLLGGPMAKYVPTTVEVSAGEAERIGLIPVTRRSWLVEGRLQNRAIRDEVTHPKRVYREMEDVPGRVADMDRLGVDVQVIFPTFFIRYNTNNAEAEQALTGAYNRWMAERCAETGGRLQWAAVLPLLDPRAAVEELRWARTHGACGVFKRGFDLDRPVTDPHFFPVYEEAQALDLPLCIHTGHPLPGREWDRGFPIMHAMYALLASNIPGKFPRLRFGLIEAGASWLPYVVSQRGAELRARLRGQAARLPRLAELEPNVLRDNRIYIALDPIDDIEYLLQFGAEDHLMIGTDYSHTDISANLNALDEVRTWADQGRITPTVARKILEDNPAAYYGF